LTVLFKTTNFVIPWQAFYDNVVSDVPAEDKPEKRRLIIAISSDRGLCGAIHSGVAKAIKLEVAKDPGLMIACVGDKSRGILARAFPKNVLFACNEVGRLPPTFQEASRVAQAILKAGYDFTEGTIYYNYFR
jgi:F-type H+-transporting ATPase subunit gamma